MTDGISIAGTYADLKTIRTRKVVQIVIEVPIEKGAEVVNAFGFPQPEHEVWLAIARMNYEPAKKEKVPFHEKPLSVQAGIRCADQEFWKFIWTAYEWKCTNPEQAATFVRTHCFVNSRADLNTDENGAANWNRLNDDFELWAGIATEARG